MTGDVTFGLVIGGPGLISDDTVRAIFGQNADSIILKKHQPNCILCGEAKNLVEYKGKLVCKNCVKNLTEKI